MDVSGLEWTHVRPASSLNKLALCGPSIRAEGRCATRTRTSPGPQRTNWTSQVAAAALLEDGHAGEAYDVNGPDLITYREQAEAIGREIRFEVITRGAGALLARGGFAAKNADFLLGFDDYSSTEQDPDAVAGFDAAATAPVPMAEPITGRVRGFAEWAPTTPPTSARPSDE
ncbi:hypothetical protein [Saccharopolyspora spinosa]|uniref:hypothetical protein n=1 Tax=Saccharopolyspora spinosa TaxID=60894 RepID=UPI0002379BEE|nr:hypothetical protein [Saccharopolyspora spinosa]